MSMYARLKRVLVGNPLATEMAKHERIPKWKALAVLSSDALSSVAYATEEILIPLSLFAVAAVTWSIPIAIAIALLLFIVTLSYSQTIQAYPNGGGAYIVSKENLGPNAGLIAGASLLIDYVLTVSVSIAAGVENIASAFPSIAPHSVLLGCTLILVIMTLNLRGIRESANIFALPTYFFIFSFLLMIGVGFYQWMTGSISTATPIQNAYPTVPLFLLLRAFSSGCSALTGVEAISNGVPIFKDPSQRNAKITLSWMTFILGAFFLAITVLSHLNGVVPQDGETTVSLLARKIFNQSPLYYLVPSSTALILFLAANTSYADFPRLLSLLARDRFVPRQFLSLGDRLVFSNGIIGLSLAATLLLIIFKGETHHLIPLYAIGVFLSFTLSQLGMVIHHLKFKKQRWIISTGINALGAVSTFIVLIVITITKFLSGAWMVIVFIPLLVFIFKQIERHYLDVAKQLAFNPELQTLPIEAANHIALIPVSGIHPGVQDALRYAKSITKNVQACYVDIDTEARKRMENHWSAWNTGVPLTILPSPYRSVIGRILDHIQELANTNQESLITVVIPEFITKRWYHQFLHNQTAAILRTFLVTKRRVVVTSVRHHLN